MLKERFPTFSTCNRCRSGLLFLIFLLSATVHHQRSPPTSLLPSSSVEAFSPQQLRHNRHSLWDLAVATKPSGGSSSSSSSSSQDGTTEDDDDPEELVARRIIVKGDVQGGYYRSCVLNEVGDAGQRRSNEEDTMRIRRHLIFFYTLPLCRFVSFRFLWRNFFSCTGWTISTLSGDHESPGRLG
jgi:hypothetical protein